MPLPANKGDRSLQEPLLVLVKKSGHLLSGVQ